jgi:uncharacterized protein (DUF58 family)
MIGPTRRTLLLALCGCPVAVLPAVFGDGAWPVWAAAAALSLFAVGLDVLLLPAASAVDVTVELPGALFLGDPDPLRIVVASKAGGELPVAIALDVAGELEPLPNQVVRCARGVAMALSLPLQLRRRGWVAVDRVSLRWPGPMGLVHRTVVRPVGRRVEVVPDVRRVKA